MFKLKLINKPKMIKLKCGFSFPNIVLANLQAKEVIPTKEVQEIVADKTYDGLSKVTVQSIPNEYIVPSGEIEFTQNGTYDVTDKASAKVNIKEKVLGTKTITSNGTYKAIDDNLDGYSEVEVATSGVDINEYFSDTITKGTSSLGGWTKTLLKMRSPLTIEGTDASNMFYGYPLNEIPQINTSNVTKMDNMFSKCPNLTTLTPQLDTSNVDKMYQMFSYCTNLITLDLSNFDFNNTSTLQEMFYYCSKLENLTLPNLSTNKDKRSARGMFSRCSKLTELDLTTLNNSNETAFMFDNCTSLHTISSIDGSKVYICNNTFAGCTALINFGGFINLGQSFETSKSANYSNYTLDLSKSTKLTEQSLINVLTNLYDIATKGVKPQQVILGTSNLANLTSEEGQAALSQAQQFGWSIS